MFDPTTGCVLWAGALTNGQGSACVYGRFWADGRSQYAHRWAAEHIHGLVIPAGYHVGHICKPKPNTLCVQHVEPQTPEFNWSLVYSGAEMEEPEAIAEGSATDGVPFYEMPDWLRQFVTDGNKGSDDDDCPF